MSGTSPPRDPRKVHVPAPDPAAPAGPPPRPRSSAPAAPSPGTSVFGTVAGTAAPARPRPVTPAPQEPGGPPPGSPPPTRQPRRRRRSRGRRILRLTAIILPLTLLLFVLGGLLYAQRVFDSIEKIPLAEVLSSGGDGTNYLIVGSDSRNVEDLVDAGLDPAGFAEDGGQRSDTVLLLRFEGGEAKMMSIPRDLYVPIAETDGSGKINAAYNGGPRRLILTIQESLGIPINHYMEVDFVSFARLVDSLGGITIDFPHPAFDRGSGLEITEAGPNHLDGAGALSFVRARHLVEVIDGEEVPDPTADLGRVQRQQQFMTAVFSELGTSRNPLTLARAAGSSTGGLRIDDTLGLFEAMRFAWRLRSLDPTPVVLPTEIGRNSSGSVLFLVEPGAQAALDQFR